MIWQIVKKQLLISMEKSTTITIINWASDYPHRHIRYGSRQYHGWSKSGNSSKDSYD